MDPDDAHTCKMTGDVPQRGEIFTDASEKHCGVMTEPSNISDNGFVVSSGSPMINTLPRRNLIMPAQNPSSQGLVKWTVNKDQVENIMKDLKGDWSRHIDDAGFFFFF